MLGSPGRVVFVWVRKDGEAFPRSRREKVFLAEGNAHNIEKHTVFPKVKSLVSLEPR